MRNWPSHTAPRSLRIYNACRECQTTRGNGRPGNIIFEFPPARRHSLTANSYRSRSSRSFLSKCVRSGGTSTGKQVPACHQHTQAASQEDTSETFVPNQPHDQSESNTPDAQPDAASHKFEIVHTNNNNDNNNNHPPETTKLVGSRTLRNLDILIRTIARRWPRTTPTVQLQPSDGEAQGGDDAGSMPGLRFSISNEDCSITCTRSVIASEESQASLEAALVELMQEFNQQVELYFKDNHVPSQDLKTFPTHRLLALLELDPMLVESNLTGFDGLNAQHVQLYRAQIYAGHEPLGTAQVWTTPGTAERLARLSADSELLKRAEQAGIGVDAVLTAPDRPNARKRPTLELQRARPLARPREYTASISKQCLESMIYTMSRLRQFGLPDEAPLEAFKPFQREQDKLALSILEKNIRRAIRSGGPTQKERGQLTPSLPNKNVQRVPGAAGPTFTRMSVVDTIRKEQEKLPIRQAETSKKIYLAIKENDVLILVSETGSGKTTQLPQILLEEASRQRRGATCNVICTQPRRIAATSVAARVARERNTHVGGSVGYQVRFDHKLPTEKGSIVYSTAGVLLRHLQDDFEQVLTECSHIVVDEIHERDLTVDLLLAFLRDLMQRRKSNQESFPKIVLMSATMKSSDFETYFSEPYDGFTPRVSSLTIPGRMYPVITYMLDDIVPRFVSLYGNDKNMMTLLKESREYLEWEDELAAGIDASASASSGSGTDSGEPSEPGSMSLAQDDPFREAITPYSLIVATVIHALKSSSEGDILIFLPGMKEIDVLADMLMSKLPKELGLGNPEKIRLFKLHSTLYDTNASVFEPVPDGCRRLIVATNIAQTSITLPSVVHVIDSGKRRGMAYDQVGRRHEFSSTWIDQATSIQRRGRAGRLREGHYWAMFSEARFRSMAESAHPEILGSDLTTPSLILKSHSNDIDLETFFARAIDAPKPAAVAACVRELKEMGMLTVDNKITPLGRFCSEFPLHPATARGLLLGRLFECLLPMLLVACHDATAPLVHSPENRRDMYYSTLSFAGTSDDDRYAFIQAFLQYEAALKKTSEEVATLRRKHVRHDAYRDMLRTARQLYDILAEYGLVSSEAVAGLNKQDSLFGVIASGHDYWADSVNLFKALSLSVMNTNIAVWDEDEEAWLAKDLKCMLRPYGVNTKQSLKLLDRAPKRKSGEIVGFGEMVRNVVASPRPSLVETSSITPLTAMLFGGPITLVDEDVIEIDGWLRYRVQCSPDKRAGSDSAAGPESAAMVVLEFRRALERLLTLASSDLMNISRLKRSGVRLPFAYGNRYIYGSEREQVQFLSRALVSILDADTQHWDGVIGTSDE